MRTAWVVFIALFGFCTFGVWACSASGSDDDSAAPRRPVTSITTETPTAASPTAAMTGSSECLSAESGPLANLQRVFLNAAGDLLSITWQTDGRLPGKNHSYFVSISPYQIALKMVDGELTKSVFDVGTNKTTILTSSGYDDVNQAGLVIPMTALPKLTQPVEWNAAITNGVSDLDTCPTDGLTMWTAEQ